MRRRGIPGEIGRERRYMIILDYRTKVRALIQNNRISILIINYYFLVTPIKPLYFVSVLLNTYH